MKKLFILLIFLGINNIYSQNFPVNKYKTYIYNQTKEKVIVGFAIGYINSNFINSTYATNRKNGNIYEDLDFNLNTRLFAQYKGFMFDINAFTFHIDTNTEYQIQNGLIDPFDDNGIDDFNHAGYDVFLTYNLFESTRSPWIHNSFKTFVGVGYQMSHISVIQDADQISNTKLNYPMWKTGIQFKLSKMTSLFAEYKQNITDETNNRKYSQLCGGLLFQFNKGY